MVTSVKCGSLSGTKWAQKAAALPGLPPACPPTGQAGMDRTQARELPGPGNEPFCAAASGELTGLTSVHFWAITMCAPHKLLRSLNEISAFVARNLAHRKC